MAQRFLTPFSASSTVAQAFPHQRGQGPAFAMDPQENHQHKTATSGATLQRSSIAQSAAWFAVCMALMLLMVAPSLAWGHEDPLPLTPSVHDPASQRSDAVDVGVPESFSHHVIQLGLILAAFFTLSLSVFNGITRRSRRTAVFCFVVILSLDAFSIAIHSVHHLFDPPHATECLGFFTSQHATGTCTDAWHLGAPSLALERSVSHSLDAYAPLHFFRSNQQRAPPALPA